MFSVYFSYTEFENFCVHVWVWLVVSCLKSCLKVRNACAKSQSHMNFTCTHNSSFYRALSLVERKTQAMLLAYIYNCVCWKRVWANRSVGKGVASSTFREHLWQDRRRGIVVDGESAPEKIEPHPLREQTALFPHIFMSPPRVVRHALFSKSCTSFGRRRREMFGNNGCALILPACVNKLNGLRNEMMCYIRIPKTKDAREDVCKWIRPWLCIPKIWKHSNITVLF